MKKELHHPVKVRTISDLHRQNAIPQPQHPLVSIIYFSEIAESPADFSEGCLMDFYMVAIKKDFRGKMRYGQSYYDFDEGVMSFLAPGQLCYEDRQDRPGGGWMLLFHADFIRNYPLGQQISRFKFFSYAVNEALYLSEKEEALIEGILHNIEQEYRSNIDAFSQDLMVAQIEVLLKYANRFYNRQFITRQPAGNEVLSRLELLLEDHFNNHAYAPLPTVQHLADQLHMSPNYLSDLLRTHTGMNTQQHIHHKLIDKAKELLGSAHLTVAEVAFQLGFEHPQSFNKLFRRKTNISPLGFRQSLQ